VCRDVARLRIEDAASLHDNDRHNGAIYLAGYAVECQLKFAYCRRKGEIYLPENLEVHDWEKLVSAAGLLPNIKGQPAMDAVYSSLVDQWGPSLRYRTARYATSVANRLYNGMKQLYRFLNELVP
jgi:hypothetical protein